MIVVNNTRGNVGDQSWQPHIAEGWPDIKKIFNDDSDPNKRFIVLLTDSSKDIVLNTAQLGGNGAYYKTSDGASYTGNATHVWDISKDIPTTLGYKVRYIQVYQAAESRYALGDVSQIDAKYLYGNKGIVNNVRAFNTTTGNRNLLEAVEFGPNAIGVSVFVQNSFYQTRSIQKIKFPSTILEGSQILIPSGMCYGAYSVNELEFPNALTSIEESAFREGKSLRRLVVPSTVNKIGSYAFLQNSGIEEIIIGDNVTNWGTNIFQECFSLKYAPNMKGCTNFTGMFNNCRSIMAIKIPGTVTIIDANAFTNTYCLASVEIEAGWICPNDMNISYGNLSVSSLSDLINNLGDNSANPTVTITIGATNLAKLTTDQIAIATSKNYTLA